MRVVSDIKALGFSLAEFSRRSGGIYIDTLKRLEVSPSSIKPETLRRIKSTLAEMKAEREQLLKQVQTA